MDVWTYTGLREVTLSPASEIALILLALPIGLFLILIVLALALRPIDLPAEAKALLVAGGGVIASFALAWLLVAHVPGLHRVVSAASGLRTGRGDHGVLAGARGMAAGWDTVLVHLAGHFPMPVVPTWDDLTVHAYDARQPHSLTTARPRADLLAGLAASPRAGTRAR